jgi:7-cyano-7-deazaguanine synthase
MKDHRTLVLLSGGLDSMAVCHFVKTQGYEVESLFIDYGQPAAREERSAAEQMANFFNLKHHFLDQRAGSTTFNSGEIFGRNSFLIFSASMFFPEFNSISIGLHANTPYYDSSPSFMNSISEIVEKSSMANKTVLSPFLNWSKGDIWAYIKKYQLPLDLTYSCEEGGLTVCGKCLSCIDRGKINAWEAENHIY